MLGVGRILPAVRAFAAAGLASLAFFAAPQCLADDLGPILELGRGHGFPELGGHFPPHGYNNASITQQGDLNRATASQTGWLNLVQVQQSGTGNIANLEQTGALQAIFLSQTGSNNRADISQVGLLNVANVSQNGMNNVAEIQQAGIGLRVNIVQNGNNGYARVIQH